MAEASQYLKTFCANCHVYDWKQPSDVSMLLRCSKCKFIRYCSKECQQEHWVKVHKHHCRYLAKEKVMRKSRHDPASCPGCIKQAEVGLAEVSKADSPYLGCPWTMDNAPLLPKPDQRDVGGDDAAFPLPFKLGEMAGQWQTKAEHTVVIMNKLLYKMKVTKHPAYTSNQEAIDHMGKLMNKMRQDIWLAYIHVVPSRLDRSIVGFIYVMVTEILKLASDISKDLSAQKYQDQTVFRPWDTFRLLLSILHQYRCDVARQDAVRLGLPGISEDDKELMVTSDQLDDTWRKVLASMDGILVPYTDLLKILCDGDLHQFCSGCSQDIDVSNVGDDYCEVPSIFQAYTQAFLCGGVECYNTVVMRDEQIYVASVKTYCAAKGNICDYCFLMSRGKVHRCTRCLTKYYCGEECRDKDWWEVHKEVCKEGQERKVKGGKDERKEKGIENVEKFVNALEKMNIHID